MGFGKLLAKYREDNGIKQKEIANVLDVTTQTISTYETGTNQIPYDKLICLCNHYKINPLELLKEDLNFEVEDTEKTKKDQIIISAYKRLSDSDRRIIDFILSINKPNTIVDNIIYLPLLEQRASAGIGKETGDISNNADDMRAFPVSNVIEKASHAIIIDGDSMQPEIIDGQIVFIDAKQECNDGDYGIFNVVVNGESIVYCKQYKFDESGKPYLHSVNPKSRDPEFSESDEVQIQCVGKIIKW